MAVYHTTVCHIVVQHMAVRHMIVCHMAVSHMAVQLTEVDHTIVHHMTVFKAIVRHTAVCHTTVCHTTELVALLDGRSDERLGVQFPLLPADFSPCPRCSRSRRSPPSDVTSGDTRWSREKLIRHTRGLLLEFRVLWLAFFS